MYRQMIRLYSNDFNSAFLNIFYWHIRDSLMVMLNAKYRVYNEIWYSFHDTVILKHGWPYHQPIVRTYGLVRVCMMGWVKIRGIYGRAIFMKNFASRNFIKLFWVHKILETDHYDHLILFLWISILTEID